MYVVYMVRSLACFMVSEFHFFCLQIAKYEVQSTLVNCFGFKNQ